jgi:hypothetical protein
MEKQIISAHIISLFSDTISILFLDVPCVGIGISDHLLQHQHGERIRLASGAYCLVTLLYNSLSILRSVKESRNVHKILGARSSRGGIRDTIFVIGEEMRRDNQHWWVYRPSTGNNPD